MVRKMSSSVGNRILVARLLNTHCTQRANHLIS